MLHSEVVIGTGMLYKYVMQKRPRILPIHMSMAATYWQSHFVNHTLGAAEIHEEATNMVRGIQMYLQHPYERSEQDNILVFNAGSLSIYQPSDAAYKSDMPVVLLVPSLINKAYILDLMSERSLLRFLWQRGVAAYLLDWGDVIADDTYSSFDQIVEERLLHAITFLANKYEKPVHLLGYCMGGTLSVAAASIKPDCVSSVVALAAPWDFHAGSAALSSRVKFWSPALLPSLKDKGVMSVDWLQMLFSSLDPALSVKKFSRFAAMEQETDDAHLFVAVEDWLNDGVALPQSLAEQTIKEWFFDNAPGQGHWKIGDTYVVPEDINVPVFVVASSKDKLVEFETAKALADGLPECELYDPACGHIGMIAGRNAIKGVWGPIVDWLCKN